MRARSFSAALGSALVLATVALAVGAQHHGARALTPDADPGSLQALIDATEPGGTLVVPPAIYREQVTIAGPITIDGRGAQIRGSDIWTGWTPEGATWRSADAVPDMGPSSNCRDDRCAWPEQVFIDGTPLLQVASSPRSGEFAVDPERRVVLADDPTGHEVEVTTREAWMIVVAPDVQVSGFSMRHAASPAQHGGIETARGADRFVLREVSLSDAHGALVSIRDVADASLLDSDLTRGGQLGVHSGGEGTTGLTIAGNRITDNNTEGFAPEWESGGVKAALAVDLLFENNVVTGNDGPGLWCDIDCRDTRFIGNRVGSNANAGIHFEISQGAVIEDNVVWDNGWAYSTWGWGAGILISSSAGAEVRGNTLAWNADGIVVVSQDRGREKPDLIRDVLVEDNTVVGQEGNGFLLAWLEDWEGGVFDAGSENHGKGNAFWPDTGIPCPFEWEGCRSSLEAFAATPGGVDSRYLGRDEAPTVLDSAGVAASPPQHELNEPPQIRRYIPAALAAGAAFLLIGAFVAVVVIRRRRASRI